MIVKLYTCLTGFSFQVIFFVGYPPAEVKWRRYTVDGPKSLNKNFHRYAIKTVPPSDGLNVVSSALIVYNLTGDDYGTYLCQGKNVVDSCEASARIHSKSFSSI